SILLFSNVFCSLRCAAFASMAALTDMAAPATAAAPTASRAADPTPPNLEMLASALVRLELSGVVFPRTSTTSVAMVAMRQPPISSQEQQRSLLLSMEYGPSRSSY